MTTYFKLLSKSSLFFINQAKFNRKNKDKFRFYIISSIIHSWLLLESYVNYISDVLSKAKLESHERIILQDMEFRIKEDGEIIEIQSHMPILKRTLFVIQRFSKINVKRLKQTDLWKNVKEAESIRNKLIHPKQLDIDKLNLKLAEKTRNSVIEFIRKINKAIFDKNINLN